VPIVVNIGGKILAAADAKISVFDRGFLYGDSVFEVMRTYAGKGCREEEHLIRLEESARRVLIDIPFTREQVRREVRRTISASGEDPCYVRIILTRGSGPLNYDPTSAHDPQLVVMVTPLKSQPPEHYREGVEVCLIRATRPTDNSQATGAKASNYLVNLLATHEVRQRGGYEAILIGGDGQLLEGASSNLFLVRGRQLLTPRAEAGILVGITRQTVLEVAPSVGLNPLETALFPQDLYEADEAFITSSLREVMPISRVDGQPIGSGEPGPWAALMREAYLRSVRGES